MTRRYSSTAQPTTLSAGCTSAATSIQVLATTGFPAVDFVLALDYGAAGQELVLVTNVAGTTLTVTRGYNSTAASAHALGAAVSHVHAAQDFTDSRTHEAATTGVHGAAGAVVGTTDAQALSNKDLSSGTNTFPASLLTPSSVATVTNKDLSSGTNVFPAALATDAEVSSAVSTHAAVTATHGATGAVVGTTNAQVLTNKSVDLATNTVTGTTAQFNAALSDNDFATLAGAETVTNKTLSTGTKIGAATTDISGAWVSYPAALTATVTSPTLGSGGSVVGSYMQIGKTIFWRVRIDSGTGPTAGSGAYQVSLPVACSTEQVALGSGVIADSATIAAPASVIKGATASVGNLYGAGSASIASGSTYSLVTGRSYYLNGTYEAA